MRVLITGAAGFIGSHLVDRYLRDGYSVIAADNLCTGDLANLAAARASGRLQFIHIDVAGAWDDLERTASAGGGLECVLHFASPASPVDYETLALETLAVNSLGTQHACETALAHGARLIFASSSEAYGDPLEHPQREASWGQVNPAGHRACYQESKRYGEAYVSTFVRKTGLDGRILRIFNTYGPRMRLDDGRVVPNFFAQALAGRPLTVYGDGSQTRSFCYVDDLVEGVVRCAAAPGLAGSITNIGNPEEHSIREFASIVAQVAGIGLALDERPLLAEDPRRRCPDIARAKATLGWEPKVSLRDGLRATYDDVCARVRRTSAS